jgi:hypothetical protein
LLKLVQTSTTEKLFNYFLLNLLYPFKLLILGF